MVKTIYLNLDDDINKVIARLEKTAPHEVVLVFPKRSQLFSDSINLRLLKKQVDLLGKKAWILTMDEMGQVYAKEAGFALKFLPKKTVGGSIMDIKLSHGNASRQKTRIVKRTPGRPASPMVPEAIDMAAPGVSSRASRDYSVLEPEDREDKTEVRPNQSLDIPRVTAHENIFDLPKTSPKARTEQPAKKKRLRQRTVLVGFVAVAMIAALVLVLFVLPSATLVVHAKRQMVSRDVELSAATAISQPDSAKLALPATLVQKTFTVDQQFTTVGKREVGAKAQGQVYIYNLTGKPINLRTSTTTLAVGNKTYVFTVDQQGVKAVSGTAVDEAVLPAADIAASGGGEDFNIPAGTRMEITNQVFGAQPQVLYAKTKTQITGGTSRFLSVVSDEDMQKAQEGFKAGALAGIQNELKEQNLTLLEGSYAPIELTDFTSDKPVGTESPNFQGKGTVKLVGLAFDTVQLAELIRDRIASTFQAGKRLQNQSKDTMIAKVRSVDTNNGILGLSVHYESAAEFEFDINDLKPKLVGKTKEEASELLLSRPEIERVDITLSPAWQNTIPRFSGKINLEMQE